MTPIAQQMVRGCRCDSTSERAGDAACCQVIPGFATTQSWVLWLQSMTWVENFAAIA
jgi:hypothetical protein